MNHSVVFRDAVSSSFTVTPAEGLTVAVPVVCQLGSLQDEFALLVFLIFLESLLIFPTDHTVAASAVDIRNRMHSGCQQTILAGSYSDIHHCIEKICFAVFAVEPLRYQFVDLS